MNTKLTWNSGFKKDIIFYSYPNNRLINCYCYCYCYCQLPTAYSSTSLTNNTRIAAIAIDIPPRMRA